LDITQQCRDEDIEEVREIYSRAGIKARLAPFFENIPELLAEAHLVISRSGASTVAEVTVAGRPAIFVPYPFHKDQQQKINADVVADAGGAWVMTQDGFTEDALLSRIENFLQNPETLFRAAEASRSCAKPDAARRLGNLVTALVSGWDKKASKAYDLTQGRQDKL
ncbi:MAG: glycosyltransferase, partial [Pseudomonadota bacterium]|nr:glycosyltransferase [Pseudomonadota bacterium]